MMYNFWKYCTALAFIAALIITGCSGERASRTPGILVSTDWLQDHLNDPDVVLLHSGTDEGFDTIHIPGARLILPYSFTVNTSTNRNEMPPADSIAELLRKVGVNSDSQILLYSENTELLNRTARVYVALDYLGLGERTFVLNGGLPAWQEEERETSNLAPEISRGKLESLQTKEFIIESAELDKQRWSNDIVVIDARSGEEYYGSPETDEESAEGGHIEGAYSLSYLKITTDESPYLFRSDTELKELFREAGMNPQKVTLIYCNSGIKGSLIYLVARHLAYPALLYDGSYEEWEELDLPSIKPVAIPDKNE